MVADISLDSLSSLTSCGNDVCCDSDVNHDDILEDVNQNIEVLQNTRFDDGRSENTTNFLLTELDNDRAPTDKMLNSYNAKLSPTSRLHNMNDWDLQLSYTETANDWSYHLPNRDTSCSNDTMMTSSSGSTASRGSPL